MMLAWEGRKISSLSLCLLVNAFSLLEIGESIKILTKQVRKKQ